MLKPLILATLLTTPFAVQAQTLEFGPGGFRVRPNGGSDCRELRAACMHKEEMGEAGMGNCRRFRELCGRGARGYEHQRWNRYREE